MNPRLTALAATATVAVSLGLTGCSSGSGGGAPSADASAPAPTVSTTQLPGPSGAPAQTLTAAQVADHGLPSRVGPGKLSTPTIKRLVQFFEDKVSHAYATGNADALRHYLAGPMLTGNVATVNLLTQKHRRNVFRIKVQSVKPVANTENRIILDLTGDMTVNYFFDPATHKILDHGLPGPSQVQFTVFLDRNPKTHTWYWTGEKAGTSNDHNFGSGVTVQ
ncbi:MAG: hypothetical protein JO214_12355 [Frankiaceae bacterium]|nr:hypothetical protein [Frankiaceae bacterium]